MDKLKTQLDKLTFDVYMDGLGEPTIYTHLQLFDGVLLALTQINEILDDFEARLDRLERTDSSL